LITLSCNLSFIFFSKEEGCNDMQIDVINSTAHVSVCDLKSTCVRSLINGYKEALSHEIIEKYTFCDVLSYT
jgi:hypothetical protein